MQLFEDNDTGYLAWVHDHPNGFVVNTERPPSPSYLMLHRGDVHVHHPIVAAGPLDRRLH